MTTPSAPLNFIRAEIRLVGPDISIGRKVCTCFKKQTNLNLAKSHNSRQSQSKFRGEETKLFVLTEEQPQITDTYLIRQDLG